MLDHVLTEIQSRVSERVLREESAVRAHVVVALSGAHAYGFPSPDSDLDLKGAHVTETAAMVGLSRPPLHAERMEVVDGVEIDYSSNEIGAVLAGILQGNGNFIERILSPLLLVRSFEHEELASLVRGAICRRVHRHYEGFARSQRHELEKAERKTAKKVLYVLRTALTGAHALRTGEIVTDLRRLVDEHGLGDVHALIERKREGERIALTESEVAHWTGRLALAFEVLSNARAKTTLPEEPQNAPALDAWLVALRRKNF